MTGSESMCFSHAANQHNKNETNDDEVCTCVSVTNTKRNRICPSSSQRKRRNQVRLEPQRFCCVCIGSPSEETLKEFVTVRSQLSNRTAEAGTLTAPEVASPCAQHLGLQM